jgi:farnesyl-diphosphate farnesyltransferase
LISIAHEHLQDALTYTLLIPGHETGIRKFCLWALGMAVLTLRKIKQNLDFTDSSQVKINRKSVKATIITTSFTVRSNLLLTTLFNMTSRELAMPDWKYVVSPPTEAQ